MDNIEVEKDDAFHDLIAVLLIACLLLAGLKFFGVGVVATWSWWAVMAPLWFPVALVGSLFTVILLLALVVG